MRSWAADLRRRWTILLMVMAAALLLSACNQSGPSASTKIDGAAIYQANCASCHGAYGEGEADWKTPKEDGTYPAPPHTVDGHTWHHGDGTLFQIIKGGGDSLNISNFKSNMPAFGETLSDEEIIAVLDYLRFLWPEDQRRMQAEISRQDPLPGR